MKRIGIAVVLIGLFLAGSIAWAAQRADLRELARALDRDMSRLQDRAIKDLPNERGPRSGAEEMRLVMAVSALRGQAIAFRRLSESDRRLDLRAAFGEMKPVAEQTDRNLRRAQPTRELRRQWEGVTRLLDRIDNELGSRGRRPGYYVPDDRRDRQWGEYDRN